MLVDKFPYTDFELDYDVNIFEKTFNCHKGFPGIVLDEHAWKTLKENEWFDDDTVNTYINIKWSES